MTRATLAWNAPGAEGKPTHDRIQVVGHGSPTVVLLTGLGVPAHWWHGLGDMEDDVLRLIRREAWNDQPFLGPALAAEVTVVSYEREGLAGQPPADVRQLDDFIQELDAVLDRAGVTGPLVVIGHSLGGVVALEYARRMRRPVVALVLLDSSHPNQVPHIERGGSQALREADAEERRELADHHPERPDLVSLLQQGDAAASPGMLGTLPVLVISRGVQAWPVDHPPAAPMTPAAWEQRERTWQDLQRGLSALSSASRHVILADSGHYVYLEDPVRVLHEIRELLRDIQGSA